MSCPTSEVGECLPIPTNDGPQQEEKWHCEANPFINLEVPQARKERQASPVMRTRMIVVVNPIMPKSLKPNNQESRTSPRDERNSAELLQMFKNLCDRAGKLNVCIMCGKESHEGTYKDITRATESDLARAKIQMLFHPETHPSSDEDVNMEGPDGEEGETLSSKPQGRSRNFIQGRSLANIELCCESP